MQNQPFPEMNHLVNIKISESNKSAGSSDNEGNKPKSKELNLKKSEYV
jgi:hypothetical protein